jgi:hypothetical protein
MSLSLVAEKERPTTVTVLVDRELAERAGHARPSMSLDVYSHVMPPAEVASERILALIVG